MFTGPVPSPQMPQNDRLGVLSSTLPVIRATDRAMLDGERIRAVAREWAATAWPQAGWDLDRHFFGDATRTLNWMAVLDALNFCFWGDATPGETDPARLPRWRVYWRNRWHDGYNALAVALRRATEAGFPLWDAAFLAEMSPETLAEILRPDPDERGVAVEIPLFAERLTNTHEVGRVLLAEYDGQFAGMVAAAQGDAVALALAIAEKLPSFDDVTIWQDQPVRFYKRAQILVSDIVSAFAGQSWGDFPNLGDLTCFADYKVPQMLRRIGILEYSADLAARIDRLELISAGSEDEIAIRAATVWGVELLRRALADEAMSVTAAAIDYRLWLAGQSAHGLDRPYHRTRTIYY
jgi:hypothetical protein